MGGIQGIGACPDCSHVDVAEWLPCRYPPTYPRRRRAADALEEVFDEEHTEVRIESLLRELFALHDLNGNGLLEELELIQLNQKIAFIHHGVLADPLEVQKKYTVLFREKLDPNGQAVDFQKFRSYARDVLQSLDKDAEAQEMILEQFVSEASCGRQALSMPEEELVMLEEQVLERTASGKRDPGGLVKPIKALTPSLTGEPRQLVSLERPRGNAAAGTGQMGPKLGNIGSMFC